LVIFRKFCYDESSGQIGFVRIKKKLKLNVLKGTILTIFTMIMAKVIFF